MKPITFFLSIFTLLSSFVSADENPQAPYLSLKLEIENAIQTGNAYLKSQQQPEGFWKNKAIPAYTALSISAAMSDPTLKQHETPDYIAKAYQWLIKQQKDTGAIYGKGLATYNTATSLSALSLSGNDGYLPAIRKARAFLISQQAHYKGNKLMEKFDGGIGYGGSHPHSDMSNTYLAIEALRKSEHFVLDQKQNIESELDWESALAFISRCQNHEATNDQPETGNDGSFYYYPGSSKAGFETQADGRKTLRGYGSMTYAGLLSFIYADLDHSDPRIVTAKKWLENHYTLEENPGLDKQGLFYYYHVMAKALTAANVQTLKTSDGKEIDWRKDLATRLLTLQQKDGSWINENSRWWENQPELVTTYVVLTLAQIHQSFPQPITPSH